MTSSRISPHLRERLGALVGRPGWRRVLLARRIAAAALVAVALTLVLLPRAGQDGVPVVVTTVDLAAGATLNAQHLTVRHWPEHLVPGGAVTEPAGVQGRVLVGAARAGEALTDLRLAGSSGAQLSAGPGAAAVAVRPADGALVAVLVPGSRVDVVTAGEADGAARVLASAASVLAVLPGPDGDPGLVMVAMPQEVAAVVAATTLTAEVAVTLR